jgi:3-oxoacyl-[acyl-carrier-protein] synthase III
MKANIKCISYYLPEKVLSNELIHLEFPEWNIDKISFKTGIESRHIAADDEFTSEMSVKAADKLFFDCCVLNRRIISCPLLHALSKTSWD